MLQKATHQTTRKLREVVIALPLEEDVRGMSESGIQAVRCSNCDYEFPYQPGEAVDPGLKGEPCPRCGNASKTYRVETSLTLYWRVWSDQYSFLLDNAKKLRDQGHYEAAIVTAQTASEVCMALVVRALLRASGIEEHVAELITDPPAQIQSGRRQGAKSVRGVLRGQNRTGWSALAGFHEARQPPKRDRAWRTASNQTRGRRFD
jgi:hypothetical protein